MSEDWPNGWYRDDPSQQARPSFTPHPEAEGSPYEPTQAVSRASSLTVDLGTDTPLPKNLITGASVAGTS